MRSKFNLDFSFPIIEYTYRGWKLRAMIDDTLYCPLFKESYYPFFCVADSPSDRGASFERSIYKAAGETPYRYIERIFETMIKHVDAQILKVEGNKEAFFIYQNAWDDGPEIMF